MNELIPDIMLRKQLRMLERQNPQPNAPHTPLGLFDNALNSDEWIRQQRQRYTRNYASGKGSKLYRVKL